MMSGRGDPYPLASSPMPCLIQRVRDGRGEHMICLPPVYGYRLTEAGGGQYNVEIRLVPRDARRYYLGKRFERADETLAPPIVNVEEIL